MNSPMSPLRVTFQGVGWTLTAVLIWCFSPLLVTLAKGDGRIPSAVIGALATTVGAVTACLIGGLWKGRRLFSEVLAIARNRRLNWKLVGLGLLAFAVYPMFYFVALQRGDPIAANLINYLWPIIAAFVVLGRFQEAITLELVLAALFGVSGAAIAYSTVTGGEGGTGGAFWPYISALLGAIAYGLYSSLLRPLPRAGRATELTFSHFLFMMGIAGLVVTPWIWGWAFLKGDYRSSGGAIALSTIPLCVYGVGMALGHFSWLRGVSVGRTPLPFFLAYLVPVGGTFILAAYKGQFSVGLFSALSFVLCGIYFAANCGRVLPVTGTIVIAVGASWQVASRPLWQYPETWSREEFALSVSLLQLLAALFGILGGFVLANAIARHKEMQGRLLDVFGRLGELRRLLQEESRARVDQVSKIVVMNTADSAMRGLVERFLDNVEEPLLRLERDSVARDGTRATRERIELGISALRLALSHLSGALQDRVSRYEWISIGVTSFLMLLLVHLVPERSLLLLLVRGALVASLIGIVFAIRDYDLNRPSSLSDLLLVGQWRAGMVSENRPAFLPEFLFRVRTGRPLRGPVVLVAPDGKERRVDGNPIPTDRNWPAEFAFWSFVLVSAGLAGLSVLD